MGRQPPNSRLERDQHAQARPDEVPEGHPRVCASKYVALMFIISTHLFSGSRARPRLRIPPPVANPAGVAARRRERGHFTHFVWPRCSDGQHRRSSKVPKSQPSVGGSPCRGRERGVWDRDDCHADPQRTRGMFLL